MFLNWYEICRNHTTNVTYLGIRTRVKLKLFINVILGTRLSKRMSTEGWGDVNENRKCQKEWRWMKSADDKNTKEEEATAVSGCEPHAGARAMRKSPVKPLNHLSNISHPQEHHPPSVGSRPFGGTAPALLASLYLSNLVLSSFLS